MNDDRRAFLESLLETPSPSGFETAGQRVWTEYVREFADDVRTDAYGNAVAVHEGSGDGPSIAFGGHADEIGFIVRDVLEDGFLRLDRVGGSDRTVSKGQHVTIHADEPVQGVIGQTAIHLREEDEDTFEDVREQFVDVGAGSAEEARELVEVGDPVTFSTTVFDLHGTRVSARGMDNRVGTWAAAEGLRRAIEADVDPTVYAVSTVQEEVGLQGAKMVGFDIDPDVAVATDVTHATDTPEAPSDKGSSVELAGGPVVSRGSTNHPALVEALRTVADAEKIAIQLAASGNTTRTDADAFYTTKRGIPSLNLSIPNRYMHTPVEVIDTDDLDEVAELMGAFAARAEEFAPFTVDI